MGSLAGLLAKAGHIVTGTDEVLYPPMSEQIAALGIKPFEGYSAENIAKAQPELVVIGNVIRRINPEAQEVLRLGLKFVSLPETLARFFLDGRTSIVISGTHGKTTTAALTAWLIETAGENPGFLIGGVGKNFGRSFEIGTSRFFVVEGDEYDTAFFDKGPKFLHYMPRAALVTSIEFDHADIYKNVGEIIKSFEKFVELIPIDGVLVVNGDDVNASAAAKKARCKVVTYGIKEGEWRPREISVSEKGTKFVLPTAGGIEFNLPMWGEHNVSNAVGAIALLCAMGISADKISKGISKFKGVRRRQELVWEGKGITVINDFAHHPTAVEKTIESMRVRFPKRRLWAIFEPRSNTSRRNIFQKEFASALSGADCVIIASPHRADAIPAEERFDSAAAAAEIAERGIDARHVQETTDIVEAVLRDMKKGDVILVMSNGGFGGLVEKLSAAIDKQK